MRRKTLQLIHVPKNKLFYNCCLRINSLMHLKICVCSFVHFLFLFLLYIFYKINRQEARVTITKLRQGRQSYTALKSINWLRFGLIYVKQDFLKWDIVKHLYYSIDV